MRPAQLAVREPVRRFARHCGAFPGAQRFRLPPRPACARRSRRSRIEIAARPIAAFEPRDPARTRFGPLTFRGGLSLTSSYREFGGISSIRVGADGARFLAVTDKGRWLRGRIVYDGTRPIGIADAEMAPILGADGKPLAARRWYDTEALAEDGGTVFSGSSACIASCGSTTGATDCWRAERRSRCRRPSPGCRTTRASSAWCSCRRARSPAP